MDKVFGDLFKEVNRLLTYPDWLPIERCQISFYCGNLIYFSYAFQNIPTKKGVAVYISELPSLVNKILEHSNYRGSWNFSHDNSDPPPNLDHVGDLLVRELTEIYKPSVELFKEAEKFREENLSLEEKVAWNKYSFHEKLLRQKIPSASNYFASKLFFDRNKFGDYEGEICVGFDAEASKLLQQLASITMKQLEVLSIVGMAGLGKTTLARRLYNDPYSVSYFYVRGWVTCSQIYEKRDLLLSILRFVTELTNDVHMMDTIELAHALYRALKGRRFLIVIDDIWSIDAWDDFKSSFPNDNNGSKIMLTTRLKDVAMHAQSDGNPLYLRFLTEEESLNLFRKKSFLISGYFDKLHCIAKNIIRKCHGLPLAIVVIAGLLKNNFEIDWWIHVDESVSSYIVNDENQYMDTLALSYNHLPQHLRTFFLYFGAFPEDSDIPLRKLIGFWIAEGLVSKTGTKRLEDVAKEFLMDLIGRSLIVASKKALNGAIKTCLIHDLLHDLCLRKAYEENFSPKVYKCKKQSYSCAYCSVSDASSTNHTRVLNISSNCSCSSYGVLQRILKDTSMTWDAPKLLRALDLSSTELCIFPSEILQLEQLRYLELRFRYGNPPESISLLTELQTLIMSSRRNMVVPQSMWKMKVLRHLCIKSGENLVSFSLEEESSLLENLQTISLVSPTRSCEHILSKTPNLRKLGLCGPLTTRGGELKCPDLSLLMNLETLKLLNTIPLSKAGGLSNSIAFPGSLRNLTVSNTYLDWKEAWLFQMIPNLEVLKLRFHAFVGKDWETSPGLVPCLKIFKLENLDIVNWTISSNHFPMLQRLEVHRCPHLMEIPADFGDICTLQWIALSGCNDAAIDSARVIQKDQENSGNDWLQILFHSQPLARKDDAAETGTW